MSFSKVIPLGSAGQISINEADGSGSVALSIGESLGGGSVAGVAKVKASVEVDASLLQLVDAGLVALEAKFPSLAPAIVLLKGLIDAEAAKI